MDIDTLYRREAQEMPLSDDLSLMGCNHYSLAVRDLPRVAQGESTGWEPQEGGQELGCSYPSREPQRCRNMCRLTTCTVFIPKKFM